jgi:phosphatidylglycerophosphatase A
MTTTLETPETTPKAKTPPHPRAIRLATAFGLGYAPIAPGTAGSFAGAVLFAPFAYGLESHLVQLGYLIVLVVLALVGLWSTEEALPHWDSPDPHPVVIDEVLGQWVTYLGWVLAYVLPPGRPATPAAGWKYLLAGFILFRVFDVIKPFPVRRSERLPGAAGVLVDDVLAGVYAAVVLLALIKTGWLA